MFNIFLKEAQTSSNAFKPYDTDFNKKQAVKGDLENEHNYTGEWTKRNILDIL